jgi:hypothetical protein
MYLSVYLCTHKKISICSKKFTEVDDNNDRVRVLICCCPQEQLVKEKERSKGREKSRKEKPTKEKSAKEEKETSPEPAESTKGTLTHLLDLSLSLSCQINCLKIIAACC